MKEKDKILKTLRAQIDQIDERIVSAINERTEIVLKIGELKNRHQARVYAPDREHDVYKKIFRLNKGPIRNKSLEAVYKEIMSASLALEREIVIGFLGPEGSFTHQACIRKFGSSLPFKSMHTIEDIFKAVEKKECDYAVVPVENSSEGGVNDTLDMFIDSHVYICSEISMPVHHNLMNKTGDITKIKKVYSKLQVFEQCRHWILNNMPHVELVEVSSSSKAACMAAEDGQSAAIASDICADMYGLVIVSRSIEHNANNVTRFVILSTEYPKPTGHDKTSLVVFMKDKVGALYDMLLYFKSHDLNLTRIESRPSKRRPWEYYFYIDFIGHCDKPKVRDLIKNLKDHCESVKILGSYPQYKEPVEE